MNRYQFTLIVCSLIIFGVSMRLLPHVPNLTPVTALALVGGTYLNKRWTILLPGVVLILSDAIIGFYDWRIALSVYGSFALIGLLSVFVSKSRSAVFLAVSIIGSSILFFLITNATVWIFSPWYEKTISGLMYCYELGLPFFRNMLVGDIFYTVALFSVFEVGRVLYRRQQNIWQSVISSAVRAVLLNRPMIH